MSEIWECVICKNFFTGWGNNAEPVASGKCCDMCNSTRVIPARLSRLSESKSQRDSVKD